MRHEFPALTFLFLIFLSRCIVSTGLKESLWIDLVGLSTRKVKIGSVRGKGPKPSRSPGSRAVIMRRSQSGSPGPPSPLYFPPTQQALRLLDELMPDAGSPSLPGSRQSETTLQRLDRMLPSSSLSSHRTPPTTDRSKSPIRTAFSPGAPSITFRNQSPLNLGISKSPSITTHLPNNPAPDLQKYDLFTQSPFRSPRIKHSSKTMSPTFQSQGSFASSSSRSPRVKLSPKTPSPTHQNQTPSTSNHFRSPRIKNLSRTELSALRDQLSSTQGSSKSSGKGSSPSKRPSKGPSRSPRARARPRAGARKRSKNPGNTRPPQPTLEERRERGRRGALIRKAKYSREHFVEAGRRSAKTAIARYSQTKRS